MKHPALVETHQVGPHTQERIVRAQDCPALATHGIAHVGLADAVAPYAMVRTDLPGAYFLACFSGEGRILLDGRWQRCTRGMACLAPPHALHAFHAVTQHHWGFAWVRYAAHSGQGPLINASAPVLAKFPAESIRAAIEGLFHEQGNGRHPAMLYHWVELIQGYVNRFAQPWHLEDRLAKLWEAVAARPEHEWTLTELSRRAHCSGEHLRRLCRSQLGRTPMQQVTYLRLRHAAHLLTKSDDKLEIIATAVGYANPFVFSNTFKKWTGWRPSEYRARKPVNPPKADR